MCFVWIWKQIVIIPLYSINWLVCITETECLLRGSSWICKFCLQKAATVAHCTVQRAGAFDSVSQNLTFPISDASLWRYVSVDVLL